MRDEESGGRTGPPIAELPSGESLGTLATSARWWLPVLLALCVAPSEILRRWAAAATDEAAGPDGEEEAA